MNKQYVLSICIASYNRKNIVVSDVKKYLSLDDTRFQVTVQDDGSTDGTFEELEKIKDSRLKLRRNQTNLGALQNAKAALDNNDESEFVLNLNDKDCIAPNVMPTFLDYLEENNPYYGYVDLSNNKPIYVEKVEKGINALKRLSYTCKHPSGFFWRSDLFHEEINKDYYKALPPKFDYQFDLMYAHCAVRYDGVIVYMPLIINANMRPELEGAKSYSYSENNLFFGAQKRMESYELFLKDVDILDIDNQVKKCLQQDLTKRTSALVTTVLRYFLRHNVVCSHYNLKPRVVSFVEMRRNLRAVLRIYSKYAPSYNSWLSANLFSFEAYLYFGLKALGVSIKDHITKYKESPLVLGA
jgi:glycosyltransferase involved in cell wall biosynthesis